LTQHFQNIFLTTKKNLRIGYYDFILINFFMIKKYITRQSILYKPYLYFKIVWLEKYFLKRDTYSQCGEDKFIVNFFKKNEKGSYLDIGAFNPIKYNNTFMLYKNGWSGTNIDLNQTSIDLFNILRPNDKNICAAVSNKVKKVKVYIENIFSPLNTISLDRSKELNKVNIRKNSYYVKTKKINDMVKKTTSDPAQRTSLMLHMQSQPSSLLVGETKLNVVEKRRKKLTNLLIG